MITLPKVPKCKSEWFKIYGDPRGNHTDTYDPEWASKQLDWFEAPFEMVLSWDTDTYVEWLWLHKRIGPAVIDALKEVCETQGEEYLITNQWNRWGGCFNYRAQRGTENIISSHAFGAAVDINPHLGPLGGPDNQPKVIVDAFKNRGFTWGGDWARVDSMHFQAGSGI